MLKRLKLRLLAIFRRRKMEAELDEELRFHLERVIERHVESGMDAQDARMAALRGFGGLEQKKEECRDARGVRLVEDLWQDLQYGMRMMRKAPAFTSIAVVMLALGIGANAAIFSVVNGVLLQPLPYKDPQRLVTISNPTSENFVELRNQNQAFEGVAAFFMHTANLTGRGEPELLGGTLASANLFTLLGIEPRLGRSFLPEEEKIGNNRVVIISHRLWQRRFGSDQKIIGQTISLNDQPHTIVGVMPPGFQFPRKGDPTSGWFASEIDIYVPLALTPEQMDNRKPIFLFGVIARLKQQLSIEQARDEMTGLAARLEQKYPGSYRDRSIQLVTLHQFIVDRARLALLVLLGAVGFVLLIACTNVANLLLVRAAARQKEMAIRAALGAGRRRVIRQLLTESVLLAVLSGSLALLLAFWGVALLQAVIPEYLPRADEIGVDGSVFGFTLLISLLTGILFGAVPAFQSSKLRLSDALKEGGRGSGGVSHNHLRNLLVISEVALALVLLVGAGLMLRSFIRLMSVDPGLDPQNVLAVDIRLPSTRYERPQQAAFFHQVLAQLRTVPGVQAAGAIYPLPLSGMDETVGFIIEGEPPLATSERHSAAGRGTGPDYFKAQGIKLLKGRDFRESDGSEAPPVVVINEAMARQHWPNQDPVGRRISFNGRDGKPVWWEIIGVVGSVRHIALDEALRPEIYIPFAQYPLSFMTLVIRTDGYPLKLVAAVRNQVQAVDKDQPISNINTMDALLARAVSQPRFNLLLLAIFAGLALLLAAVGIYGVMSYLVTQRTHEIGVRMALGAQTRDVIKLVVRQGMALTLTGVVIGLIAAFGLTRLIKNLLFGVSATDPVTFSMIAILLSGVALLACYLPARRATKVDPIVALRQE
jgi:predicted permease